MKAVMVNQPGDVSALVHVDLPDPEPKDHEVVLEVHSCGVCFHDVLTRNGTLKAGVRLPCVLGHEVAGTVVALGSHARGFKLGDRVATTQRSYICGHCRFWSRLTKWRNLWVMRRQARPCWTLRSKRSNNSRLTGGLPCHLNRR